jgi:hypothetical protein
MTAQRPSFFVSVGRRLRMLTVLFKQGKATVSLVDRREIMNKIKIFTSSYGRGNTATESVLEREVNDWLQSSKANVISMIQSNSDDVFILTIWYRA